MKEKSELEKLAEAKGVKVSKTLLKWEKLAKAKGVTVPEALEDERRRLCERIARLQSKHCQKV